MYEFSHYLGELLILSSSEYHGKYNKTLKIINKFMSIFLQNDYVLSSNESSILYVYNKDL